MTRTQFATLVTAFVTTHGRAYLTDETELNEFYNEMLRTYSYRTLCLYDDAVPLTLVIGTPTYDLRALTPAVFRPQNVMVDGTILQDYDNQNGPVSILELAQDQRSYLTSEDGSPLRWSFLPPQTIRFWPAPDAVYADTYVSGYTLHPEIATSAGGDATELSLPEEHQRTAAVFAAINLLEPNAAADSDYARMKVIDPRAAADMKRHEDFASEMISRGTRRRGARISSGWRRLGG